VTGLKRGIPSTPEEHWHSDLDAWVKTVEFFLQRGAQRDDARGAGAAATDRCCDHPLPGIRQAPDRMVDSVGYGRLRATVGHIETSPGLPSVVPDRAEIVDLRNSDDADMARAEADLAAFLNDLPDSQPDLRVEAVQMARTKAVPFDEGVQDVLETAATERGFDSMRLISGAGHDAQEIAPAAMVFVRGQYQGISHNPREYSAPEDCRAGIEVLSSAVLELSA
jgi:N-carbamoyl-L-amino-acid hydrolase